MSCQGQLLPPMEVFLRHVPNNDKSWRFPLEIWGSQHQRRSNGGPNELKVPQHMQYVVTSTIEVFLTTTLLQASYNFNHPYQKRRTDLDLACLERFLGPIS